MAGELCTTNMPTYIVYTFAHSHAQHVPSQESTRRERVGLSLDGARMELELGPQPENENFPKARSQEQAPLAPVQARSHDVTFHCFVRSHGSPARHQGQGKELSRALLLFLLSLVHVVVQISASQGIRPLYYRNFNFPPWSSQTN